MTGKTMQVLSIERLPDVRAWLLMWINCLAALAGLQVVSLDTEFVQIGCRQIPKGYCDFDPALADHFKTRGMRNGKPITLAMDYSLVARWNHSNKKLGKDERTYGSDYDYAHKWGAEVSRQTWGRHMNELATLGFVSVSTVNHQPAYQALPYRILNGVLTFMENSHGQSDDFHEPKAVSHEPKPDFHGHINRESSKSLALESLGSKTTSTPARAAAVDEITKPSHPENYDDYKTPIPETRDPSADVDGDDELMHPQATSEPPRPIPPFPPLPPAPDDDTDPDGIVDKDAVELQKFFTGKTMDEVKALIAKHGATRIYATIKGVPTDGHITNPPGFVLAQLEKGVGGKWKLPIQAHSEYRDADYYTSGQYGHLVNRWRHDDQDPKRYIEGKYADFIEH